MKYRKSDTYPFF